MEPLLVGDDPCALDAGEESPCHATDFQARCLVAEARRSVSRESGIDIETLGKVVVGLGIPHQFTGLVVGTVCVFERQGTAHVRRLVVTRIVSLLGRQFVVAAEVSESCVDSDAVGLIAVQPRDARVALDGSLAGCLAGCDVVQVYAIVESVDNESGHALDGQVIVLVGVDQSQREMLADGEMLVELVFRHDGEHDETVALRVTVLSFTMLKDGRGVGQAATSLEHSLKIVVGLGKIVAQLAMLVVGIRRKEGRLGEREEARRGDDTRKGGERSTVVAQSAVDIAIGGIEPHVETFGHLDVGVESHVEPRIVVLHKGALAKCISHREVITGDIVTTLYVDAIVLGEGIVVDLLRPVGLVVILVVIVISRVAVEIFHGSERTRLAGQQFGGVESIVLGLHHRGEFGNEFEARVDVHVDLRCHALVALGFDDEHTVGALGSVESRSVFHDGDVLDVVDIEVGEHIVVITIVEHLASVLHVHDDIVDDDERLRIGMERVDALDEHDVSNARDATARDGAHVSTELPLDERVDGQFGGVGKVVGRGLDISIGLRSIGGREGLMVESAVGHLALLGIIDSLLLQVVAFEFEDDGARVFGHFNLVAALLIGHGGEPFVAIGGNMCTVERFAVGGIDNLAGDGLGGHLRHCVAKRQMKNDK